MHEEHPSDAVLQRFVRGELTRDAAKAVVAHLLAKCDVCLAHIETLEIEARCHVSLPGRPPAPDPTSESAYDMAIDRAVAGLFLHGDAVLQKKQQAGQLKQLLAQGGLRKAREHPMWGATFAAYDALLSRAWEIRYARIGEMIELTRLACFVAPKLGREGYTPRQVADFSARAWGEHGNALRIADRFGEAEECLDRAISCWLEGTRDRFQQARLMHFTASLLGDQRRIAEATQYMTEVCDLYLDLGDRHSAGKAVVNLSLYVGETGDAVEATRLADRALSLLDPRQEPELQAFALYNKLHFLVEGGSFREARSGLWKHRRQIAELGQAGQINNVKLSYLEGRINAGLGELDRAERQLKQALADLEAKEIPLLQAIVSLELAAVWMLQGRAEEARALAVETADRLLRLGLAGEAARALPILRRALERQAVTVGLFHDVVRFLRREDHASYARLSHDRCSG
jgi:tetratricopeptide (TPR) repeat protein